MLGERIVPAEARHTPVFNNSATVEVGPLHPDNLILRAWSVCEAARMHMGSEGLQNFLYNATARYNATLPRPDFGPSSSNPLSFFVPAGN